MEPPEKKARLEVSDETSANTDAMLRFEAERAIGVDVADGTVMVHPALLGFASPVFAAMLSTDMHEKRQQKLNLPGKTKEDLQLFLEFVRPGSRKRVDVGTVDRMLPWFDEYQTHDLKEECQTLLTTLPVNSQRLLQADRFGLARQYQRCVKALSFQEYKTGLADLVAVPSTLRDVRPHLEDKRPNAKPFCALVDKLIEKGVDLKGMLPLLVACLGQDGGPKSLTDRFCALVDNFIEKGVNMEDMVPLLIACLEHEGGTTVLTDDVMPLLVDLNKSSDPLHVAAAMMKLHLSWQQRREQALANVSVVAEKVWFNISGVAPYNRHASGTTVAQWARREIEALRPLL